PATAARPTLINLASTNPGGTDDLGMTPADMLEPADLRPVHFTPVYMAPNRPLYAISGTTTGGLTVVAVGNGGTAIHGNGTTFSMNVTGGGIMSGVWLASATQVWTCDR